MEDCQVLIFEAKMAERQRCIDCYNSVDNPGSLSERADPTAIKRMRQGWKKEEDYTPKPLPTKKIGFWRSIFHWW